MDPTFVFVSSQNTRELLRRAVHGLREARSRASSVEHTSIPSTCAHSRVLGLDDCVENSRPPRSGQASRRALAPDRLRAQPDIVVPQSQCWFERARIEAIPAYVASLAERAEQPAREQLASGARQASRCGPCRAVVLISVHVAQADTAERRGASKRFRAAFEQHQRTTGLSGRLHRGRRQHAALRLTDLQGLPLAIEFVATVERGSCAGEQQN